ncbi:MAG: FAD:protein FMN transferase [Planctomycetales bacterium]|nr:FAD:protein FMN transferase [Planctomycetales bacterium]
MTTLPLRSISICRSLFVSVVLGTVIGPPLPAEVTAADLPPLIRFEFTQKHMGMPFRVAFYARSEPVANEAAAAAFERIKQLDRTMSDYDPDSELSRLCQTAGQRRAIRMSDDLLAVLIASQDLACRSDGAFDVTVGPVVRLWRKARKTRKMPLTEELAAARKLVGYRNLVINREAKTAELCLPGMQLDLGGIAVGFACDEAMKVLRRHGITSALIDGSGDILVSDAPPGERGWRVGVAPRGSPTGPPTRFLTLTNASVTTSGDAWQFVEIEGHRYSHIIDPATGLGLTDRSSVTVIALTGMIADGYATTVSALGPERGLQLIEDTCDAAVLIVRAPIGKEVTFVSSRWRRYEQGQ